MYIKSQEFLIALSAKNYEAALSLARDILALDAKNDLFMEYETVLLQKIQNEESSDETETASESNSSQDTSSSNSDSN